MGRRSPCNLEGKVLAGRHALAAVEAAQCVLRMQLPGTDWPDSRWAIGTNGLGPSGWEPRCVTLGSASRESFARESPRAPALRRGASSLSSRRSRVQCQFAAAVAGRAPPYSPVPRARDAHAEVTVCLERVGQAQLRLSGRRTRLAAQTHLHRASTSICSCASIPILRPTGLLQLHVDRQSVLVILVYDQVVGVRLAIYNVVLRLAMTTEPGRAMRNQGQNWRYQGFSSSRGARDRGLLSSCARTRSF
jgi:hypothetical protein